MFHRLIGKNSIDLMNTSDRLSEYILRMFADYPGDDQDAAHKKAIMVAYLTCHSLQSTYAGKESLHSIMDEISVLLNAFASNIGDA
jgi:division protein CdvB (Snf7/Vps24/ESCRT-III family)